MFERIIVIIDDNKRVNDIYIPSYSARIEELKTEHPEWANYAFNLIHMSSMQEAQDYLKSQKIVDVLVVDYDFNGEKSFSSGTEFIEYVREKVNKHCRIIFYTMQGKDSICVDELIALINSDVYKMVDKSDDAEEMGNAIFEAATKCDPIVISLERFFAKYQTLLSSYKYSFFGEEMLLNEAIDHIRMDDKIGRVLIDKLLQKAILLETNIKNMQGK